MKCSTCASVRMGGVCIGSRFQALLLGLKAASDALSVPSGSSTLGINSSASLSSSVNMGSIIIAYFPEGCKTQRANVSALL